MERSGSSLAALPLPYFAGLLAAEDSGSRQTKQLMATCPDAPGVVAQGLRDHSAKSSAGHTRPAFMCPSTDWPGNAMQSASLSDAVSTSAAALQSARIDDGTVSSSAHAQFAPPSRGVLPAAYCR